MLQVGCKKVDEECVCCSVLCWTKVGVVVVVVVVVEEGDQTGFLVAKVALSRRRASEGICLRTPLTSSRLHSDDQTTSLFDEARDTV
jgi:hypothetical protein